MTTLFEHLNEIYQNQRVNYWDQLNDDEKKSWNNWMINRFISMNSDYIEIVNEVQKYYGQMGNRELYLFYSQLLPRGRQFYKYIKSIKEKTYSDDIIELVSKHYMISNHEAIQYLNIYNSTSVGKEQFKNLCLSYGIETAQRKNKNE